MPITTDYYDEETGKVETIDFDKTPFVVVGDEKSNPIDKCHLIVALSAPLKKNGVLIEVTRTRESKTDSAELLAFIRIPGESPGGFYTSLRIRTLCDCLDWALDELDGTSAKEGYIDDRFYRYLPRAPKPAFPFAFSCGNLDEIWVEPFSKRLLRLLDYKRKMPDLPLRMIFGVTGELPFELPGNCLKIVSREIPEEQLVGTPTEDAKKKIDEYFGDNIFGSRQRTALHHWLDIPYEDIPAAVGSHPSKGRRRTSEEVWHALWKDVKL